MHVVVISSYTESPVIFNYVQCTLSWFSLSPVSCVFIVYYFPQKNGMFLIAKTNIVQYLEAAVSQSHPFVDNYATTY